MTQPATLWIVDRDPRRRAALARLAGSEHSVVQGAPEDSQFGAAALPRVVVLGLSNDFEAELDFVHRLRPRVDNCGWILIARGGDRSEIELLFDTLDARVLDWPPPAIELRRAIRSLCRVRSAAPLSQRTGRESLSARFARWFSGGELSWLLRTLDPSLASVPILVRGETGTGRRLLARYIHAFGSEPGAAFVPVFCEGVENASQLLSQLELTGLDPGRPAATSITIWLDQVDCLPLNVQRQLHSWIDFGTPPGAGASPLRARWTASAGEESAETPERQIEAGLAQALSGLVVRLTPLRDQPESIERFTHDTVTAWCEERGSQPREFDATALEALRLYPWPGNLAELESVVARTLANCGSSIVTCEEICFDAETRQTATQLLGPQRTAVDDPSAMDDVDEAVLEPEAGRELERAARTPLILDNSGASANDDLAVEAELEPHEADLLEYSIADLEAEIEGESVPEGEFVPDSETVTATEPTTPASAAFSRDGWTRILRSVAHEVRNPLVSIRTFSELLPEHHDDAEFRERFSELVGADVRRIEDVVSRLQDLSELSQAKRQPVDIANMLDDLLEARRPLIEARRLLVLKELDQAHPMVLGDPQLLRGAFEGIFVRALEWVPERGDLYLASRHRAQRPGEAASLRVLLRFQGTSAARHSSAGAVPSLAESTLEFVAAEAVFVGLGGAFTCDTTERETVVVVDLPAPSH